MFCLSSFSFPFLLFYQSIGTLLELTRSVAIKLAEQNLRVRVCVQGSMGVGIFTGIPKTLSGVSTLLQRMDWQSGEGEENEGLLEGFPTQVNGWSIDASIGFFPSLFALMFTSWFIPTSNELPTAREHFMNNALKKLTISLVVLSILLIVVL